MLDRLGRQEGTVRTSEHDDWIFDTFGVRMPGVAASQAAPRPLRLNKLLAAGRALAAGGRRALADVSQGGKRAAAELRRGAVSGGATLATDLRHAGGTLSQGVAGAMHDAADGARHGRLAAGLAQAGDRLGAAAGQAVGETWHGLTALGDKGAHGGLMAVRAGGRATGQAFGHVVDGASAGVARVAGARAGASVRRDAQRLSQPVRFVANFGLGAVRGMGEVGGEIVKGTGDLAVGAFRLSSDAQRQAKLGRDAKALWHRAKPAAADAALHPRRTARAVGHAVEAAVNKTLDEGEAAQRDGSFAEWDGHFGFKLATNIVTAVMPGPKAAKLEEAATAMRGVAEAVGEGAVAARLAEGAGVARTARRGRAAAHAMADLGDGERAAVRHVPPAPSDRNPFQERFAKGPREGGPMEGVPPLTEQVAFQFAIQKDNTAGSWFEANCKFLAKEEVLAKLESMREAELKTKAPYCHAFMRASALSRETGVPMVVDAKEAFRHLRTPIGGLKALGSAPPGHVRFPPDVADGLKGQGRRLRTIAAKSITGIAGTAKAMDRTMVTNAIAKHVPAEMIGALKAKGVDIAVVRDSIVERLPHLKGEQMVDYASQTAEQTRGVYSDNGEQRVIAIASVLVEDAVKAKAGIRRIPGRGGRGTVDMVLHEVAHAVEANLHGATKDALLSDGPAFRKAVALDAAHIQKEYVAMGRSETFAEYMARFMRQPEDLKQKCPNLYAYFHSLVNRLPRPTHGP